MSIPSFDPSQRDFNQICSAGEKLARVDRICSYIPILSTVTGALDLFQKTVCGSKIRKEQARENFYLKRLGEGSYKRIFLTMVPVLGNIAIGVLDWKCFKKEKLEESIREVEHAEQIEVFPDILLAIAEISEFFVKSVGDNCKRSPRLEKILPFMEGLSDLASKSLREGLTSECVLQNEQEINNFIDFLNMFPNPRKLQKILLSLAVKLHKKWIQLISKEIRESETSYDYQKNLDKCNDKRIRSYFLTHTEMPRVVLPDDKEDPALPMILMSDEEKDAFLAFRRNISKTIVDNYLERSELRGINTKHREMYVQGKETFDKAQQLYLRRVKNLSLYVMFALNDLSISNIDLIKRVAQGRRFIASLAGTPQDSDFGKERKEAALVTFLVETYKMYGNRAIQFLEEGKKTWDIETRSPLIQTSFVIGGSYCGSMYPPRIKSRTMITDDVWKLLGNLWDTVRCKPELSYKELGERIGLFHWYFAQIAPFVRGTAAVAEILTDALWLHHGYIPPVATMFPDGQNKISLDLEALVPESGPGKTPDGLYPEDRFARDYLKYMRSQTIVETHQTENAK